jgi:TRAP-type C4-dicarboxylate transport system permease large subunit
VLNVVCGVARVPMGAVIKGVIPFFLAQTTVLFLLVLMPQWVLAPLAFLRGRIDMWELLYRLFVTPF